MSDTLKNVLVIVVIAGSTVLFIPAGCNVSVPIAMQKRQGLPSKVGLDDAYSLYDSLIADARELASNIERTEAFRSFLGGMAQNALTEAAPFLGPAGAALPVVGALLVGWLGMKRPRDKTLEEATQERDEHYTMAQNELIEALRKAGETGMATLAERLRSNVAEPAAPVEG